MDLLTALEKKLITAEAVSNGRNSEECANVRIKNLTGEKIQLRIPPGTLLNSSDNSEQDLLITRPTDIMVDRFQGVTVPAYGFCCQADNGLPSEGHSFGIEKCSNENLQKMANYLAEKPYDPSLQQAAIWSVSNDHSIGGIYGDNENECAELRKFTADLLKQPVPFYDVDYGYELNTEFVYAPKTLEGTMQYQLTREGKASLGIYDPSGNLFHVFYTDQRMDWGYYTQSFKFTATGMDPGDYTVVLVVDGRKVNQQTIRI